MLTLSQLDSGQLHAKFLKQLKQFYFHESWCRFIYKLHWNIIHKSTGVRWNVGPYKLIRLPGHGQWNPTASCQADPYLRIDILMSIYMLAQRDVLLMHGIKQIHRVTEENQIYRRWCERLARIWWHILYRYIFLVRSHNR